MKNYIFPFTLCLFFLTGCQGIGNYEGLTAEEWFNEYDVAEAKNQELKNQISDLEYEKDDFQVQLDDIEAEKSELEDELQRIRDDYNGLKSCLRIWPNDTDHCTRMY